MEDIAPIHYIRLGRYISRYIKIEILPEKLMQNEHFNADSLLTVQRDYNRRALMSFFRVSLKFQCDLLSIGQKINDIFLIRVFWPKSITGKFL